MSQTHGVSRFDWTRPACGEADPDAETTGNPDDVTCPVCAQVHDGVVSVDQ